MHDDRLSITGPRRPMTLLWPALLALLLAPAVAMQVTDEMNWGPGDFMFAAGLLGLLGIAIELSVRRLCHPLLRVGAATVALALVLTVWAEAAVGIF